MQDFSGLNISGKSFQGKNLTNANFEGADIRGANFQKSVLKGANFSNTKSGLRFFHTFLIFLLSLLLFLITGIVAGIGGIFILGFWHLETNLKTVDYIYNVFILISLVTFVTISLWKNFLSAGFLSILILTPSLLLGLVSSGDDTAIIAAFFFGIAALSLIAISMISMALANTIMSIIISH
ncbi:pentapeptide repeat protein [Richelia sinica FACHB-800]|uniref:Pentapeptide repeat protein n=1 Tax=Richelia sinica FACHB-800 TaxID=1357546 RepID=A0A975TBV4_9NOST|nr:pentapeptide repeat-containing protein [Richelia sinica]QXE25046.1 pentapeptide repeat protein [Richelia sinica FACHB-800]